MNVFEIPKPMLFIGNPRKPIGSMYCIFAYIGSIFMVNSGKYSIHGSYGKWYDSNWKHIHLISRIHGTFVYIYLHEVILYPSSPGSLVDMFPKCSTQRSNSVEWSKIDFWDVTYLRPNKAVIRPTDGLPTAEVRTKSEAEGIQCFESAKRVFWGWEWCRVLAPKLGSSKLGSTCKLCCTTFTSWWGKS